MTDLYLIAHKCRGEPAFDIATRIRCPECEAAMQGLDYGTASWGCNECDQEGYWWIISTSGHRAYPWWDFPLGALMHDNGDLELIRTVEAAGPMPIGLQDHYMVSSRPKLDLTSILNLRPQRSVPTQPFPRRL